MSSLADWSYTAIATIWKVTGKNAYGDPTFSEPETFYCDYEIGLSKVLGNLGKERVITNTIWTEYKTANVGDYVLIGESQAADPLSAGADEILNITRFADTIYRVNDDYAIVTGV